MGTLPGERMFLKGRLTFVSLPHFVAECVAECAAECVAECIDRPAGLKPLMKGDYENNEVVANQQNPDIIEEFFIIVVIFPKLSKSNY